MLQLCTLMLKMHLCSLSLNVHFEASFVHFEAPFVRFEGSGVPFHAPFAHFAALFSGIYASFEHHMCCMYTCVVHIHINYLSISLCSFEDSCASV